MNFATALGKVVAIVGIAGVGICQSASPEPSQPTHYFYTPTGYINSEFDVVVSLHEAAFTLPHNFQVYHSFVDNVGRVCFGGRYGIRDNLNVGAGLAWSFVTFPNGGHGVHREYEPRFGVNLAWAPIIENAFEMSLVPHMQIGNHFSMGADVGMMGTPSEYWSIIGEFGFSYDLTTNHEQPDPVPYFNTILGARVHPPRIPCWSFDAGVDFVESRPEYFAQRFWPYFDVIFTMKAKPYINQ